MAEVDSDSTTQHAQGKSGVHSHPQKDAAITLSLPASSRAMGVLELQLTVFHLVDISPERKKTLLALALTCTSFTGMALDLLWKNLDDVTPLVRCLPRSLWTILKRELRFRRVMTLDDWSVLRKYNHRVHSVDMKVSYSINVEIWTILGYPPFPLPLLPNLTSLSCDTNNRIFSYIRLFATQKLTTLNIHHTCSGALSVQSILSCMPSLYPSISHFRFSGLSSADISITLQSWSHLLSVTTEEISDAAILYLANLPSLRELSLKLRLKPIAAKTQRLLQRSAFSALRELSVKCCSLAPLDAFFKTLRIAPKILSFTIDAEENFVQTLPDSMRHISNACAPSTLEHLHVCVTEAEVNLATSIDASAFQPFYTFHNLRKLDFHSGFHVQLDDTTLLQMAKAWPLLEVFTIRTENCRAIITANSLAILLQHWPRLTSVSIDVDWSAVDRDDISPDIPYRGPPHKNLSYAGFHNSKIHHATGVAAFLSAIAPKLKHVAWDAHKGVNSCEKYHLRWETVGGLVKTFSAIREHERRMMADVGGADIRVGGEDPEGSSRMETWSESSSEDSGSEDSIHMWTVASSDS